MILPSIRASFGRSDALHLVRLLGRGDDEIRDGAQQRLDDDGIDALLDDPRVLNSLLTSPETSAPPALIFYVLVRHALLETGIDDRSTADYVATLVLRFGSAGRAYRPSEGAAEEFHYLVDLVTQLQSADARRAFLLRTHMGNFSLWITGLFPDWVEARVRRRGAPSLRYYEQMGTTGYRLAADSREAQQLGVDDLLHGVAAHFSGVRGALNIVSDRWLWPDSGNPVNRLLREVAGRPGDG